MPGHNRDELTAELKITPSPRAEQPPQAQVEAVMRAAGEAGPAAHEAGPDSVVLSGGREEVLDAARRVTEAALDAGAKTVEVRVEAQEESGRFGEAGGRRGSP
ncbi:hypothetical protein GBA65_15325 [Rubrobacter marinus]|uniref:Thiamine-binding protein domain-containing protein n=1 Tax=Rubrobacter marinus TaxID=2653852 RepID=A0A6G8PZP4_9ACTN|nr:hypothetical protein [Rubrobacter marinus]QIN79672.1 hypothetical protein GBA65_15325 [Rubrobacter marinus]